MFADSRQLTASVRFIQSIVHSPAKLIFINQIARHKSYHRRENLNLDSPHASRAIAEVANEASRAQFSVIKTKLNAPNENKWTEFAVHADALFDLQKYFVCEAAKLVPASVNNPLLSCAAN